jgi:putative addiction module antidote
METTIRKVGNSLGVILPKQLIDNLNLKNGDTLSINQNGNMIEIKPVDVEFEKWLDSYNELNLNYKEVMQALAK